MRKTVIPVLLAISLSAYAQETKTADTAKTTKIEEVVVTSLGIKRQVRSLTYSSQQIGGDELTEVKTPNLLNSINGKVSNVQINKTNGGVGGSVRVVMRGDKSTRNSQPLYVIDGIPIINNTKGPNVDFFASMPDTGDVLSTINPEDIESINFLKGASAAALYGAAGGNGAVLIVTKKGKTGRSKLSYTTSLTLDRAYSFLNYSTVICRVFLTTMRQDKQVLSKAGEQKELQKIISKISYRPELHGLTIFHSSQEMKNPITFSL
ncbi:Vitamin B12 transporter BtuB [Chryseobacterium oranimense G311]|uniref:TonB-dependent receptor plug domain-containing protein n=1 Tax=Chryseobacterium oranimense TaxID=421058 RepID=UPI00053395A3|nr:TonB-dependent receptor plug domain-containing protein [Chryseobacterium oranimense]CEJ68183.1 Vitamin B12 transporter BtuB [Chryseobacterium oranimense G311]